MSSVPHHLNHLIPGQQLIYVYFYRFASSGHSVYVKPYGINFCVQLLSLSIVFPGLTCVVSFTVSSYGHSTFCFPIFQLSDMGYFQFGVIRSHIAMNRSILHFCMFSLLLSIITRGRVTESCINSRLKRLRNCHTFSKDDSAFYILFPPLCIFVL